MNQPTSSPAPDPGKPYSPPELEELGAVDEQTEAIGYIAQPGEQARPGPQVRP